ncbi:uncharacterized protein LOC111400401 [Olea europaea var. sylvestris]|uniref:uncharacterized protein LOC111400401 n=1 Tax=Olea europaea var. sylvestris TaxID=158386 RepID=UPI000C1D360F|nr:uncharacterized protein LOC111400401 [Olea europaea var. sylvestris]
MGYSFLTQLISRYIKTVYFKVYSYFVTFRVIRIRGVTQEEIESNTGSQRDDEIRRTYVQKGPCQPRNHLYPQKEFGDSSLRRFKTSWFNNFLDWLEYSIAKDIIFCFYCFLFKPNSEEHGGGDSFIDGGFSNWKKKGRLQTHVGKSGSAHNRAQIKYEAFWLCDHNKEIKDVCLSNAPENHQLISPKIQKDIVSAIAFETLDVIMRDIGDRLFSILVDESHDVSMKEQMSIVLRYVN